MAVRRAEAEVWHAVWQSLMMMAILLARSSEASAVQRYLGMPLMASVPPLEAVMIGRWARQQPDELLTLTTRRLECCRR